MAEFVKAASLADVAVGVGTTVDVAGRQLAIFEVGGTIYAIDNACKHQGGPLAEGDLDGLTVTCPWHGWSYDVSSGRCLEDSTCAVDTFEVRVEGDDIWVKL